MAFPNARTPYPIIGESNGNSSCILSRELFYVAIRMGNRITSDMLAVIGEAPIATVDYGKYIAKNGQLKFDDGGWNNEEDYAYEQRELKKVPTGVNGGDIATGFQAEAEESPTSKLGTNRPVRLKHAKEIIATIAFIYQARLEYSFRSLNSYRSFRAMRESKPIVGRAVTEALKEIAQNALPQRRRERGVQQIYTRKWVSLKANGFVEYGKKHGLMAWKRKGDAGRPALSAWQWKRRYYARYRKRVKDPAPFSSLKITVPKAIRGRPVGVIPRVERKEGVDGNQSPQLRHSGTIAQRAGRGLRGWMHKMKGELGEKLQGAAKEAIEEWVRENPNDWEGDPGQGF